MLEEMTWHFDAKVKYRAVRHPNMLEKSLAHHPGTLGKPLAV